MKNREYIISALNDCTGDFEVIGVGTMRYALDILLGRAGLLIGEKNEIIIRGFSPRKIHSHLEIKE